MYFPSHILSLSDVAFLELAKSIKPDQYPQVEGEKMKKGLQGHYSAPPFDCNLGLPGVGRGTPKPGITLPLGVAFPLGITLPLGVTLPLGTEKS